MSVEKIVLESHSAREAAGRCESVEKYVLQACPPALQFVDLLRTRCGVRCADVVDHLILPGDDFETAGWVRIGERRWRHPNSSAPDIVRGDRTGFALRVDDVRRFTSVVRAALSDSSILDHGLRVRLFETSDVVVEAVDEASWRGLCEPPTNRIVRRAQLHRQLLRTRPRHFKSTEGGIEATTRMLQAATADLGSAWASALFLCAEREFWASRCEPGYLRFRRQSQFGIGWSNVEYHSYDCSRTCFHLCVRLFEAIGFRHRDLMFEEERKADGARRAMLVMEHRTLRTIVLLKVDAVATDASEDFGRARLSPSTRHGQSGLWCAVHGESILEGGMSHIAARYDAAAVRDFFEQEEVELLSPLLRKDLGLVLQLTKGDRRPVNPRRVHALQRQGYIGREQAEDFRLNGAIATHFAIVEPNGPGRGLVCSPETPLARGVAEKARKQRHRCKRSIVRRSAART